MSHKSTKQQSVHLKGFEKAFCVKACEVGILISHLYLSNNYETVVAL